MALLHYVASLLLTINLRYDTRQHCPSWLFNKSVCVFGCVEVFLTFKSVNCEQTRTGRTIHKANMVELISLLIYFFSKPYYYAPITHYFLTNGLCLIHITLPSIKVGRSYPWKQDYDSVCVCLRDYNFPTCADKPETQHIYTNVNKINLNTKGIIYHQHFLISAPDSYSPS